MSKYLFVAAAFLALEASAITATKEYVDRRDGEVLQAAKDYADAHGGGAGATDGEAVTNIVDGIVARNARRKDDLAVYEYRPLAQMQGGPGSQSASHYRFDFVKTDDRLATMNDVKGYLPTTLSKDVRVDLGDEEGGIGHSITFGYTIDVMRIDGDYDDGAVFFGGSVLFDGWTKFRCPVRPDDDLIKPGWLGHSLAKNEPDSSAMFGSGIIFTPAYTDLNQACEYLLKFPQEDGTLATREYVKNATAGVATGINLDDAAIGRKWELSANNGVFTFTLIEEAAK